MFLKIDKRIKDLSTSEAFVYLMIVYSEFQKKNNFQKEMHRKYIATALGIESLDYVSQMITNLVNKGLLKRDNRISHSHKEGKINIKLNWDLVYEKWFAVSVDFVRDRTLSPKEKGFLLRYRCLLYDDSFKTDYNKTEIAANLGVSLPTLRKYTKRVDVIDRYFEKQKRCCLSPTRCETAKDIAETASKDSKIYKQLRYFIENEIYTQHNADEIFDSVVAGVFGNKKIKIPEYKFSLCDESVISHQTWSFN